MKRNLASLLLISLLASLAACGGEAGTNDTTAFDNTDTTTAPPIVDTETDRSEIIDDLPEADLNGYKFRVIGRNTNFVYNGELGAEVENGEVVNDASFKRNQAVEERLNIEIVSIPTAPADIHPLTQQAIMADDDAYDLIFNASHMLPYLAAENMLLDWYQMDYIDFSKPWWSTDAIDELSIAGHTFFAAGDATLANIGIAMCIFYNKTLGAEFNLGNIYEVVNDGKWTYDYFQNTVKDIHRDLNGDSKMDSEDLYGFGNNLGSTLQPFVFSLGGRFTVKDKDDLPEFTMNNEKFISIFEKVYDLHMNNEGVYADKDFKIPREMFADSKIVFNTGAVYHTATLYRGMEDEIGVLPFPKADEAMEKYYTCHDPDVSLMAVPVTVSDPDNIGLVIEALAIESYKTLTPAFYETALQIKYSRDEESVQMLDLIKNGTTFDFAILYNGGGMLSQCMAQLMIAGSKDFASYYAANSPAELGKYNDIIAVYKNLQ